MSVGNRVAYPCRVPIFWTPSDRVAGSAVLEVLLQAHADCGADDRYGVEYAVAKLYGIKMSQALAVGEEITDAYYAG